MRVLGQGLDILHDEAAAQALSVHDIVIRHTEANLERIAARTRLVRFSSRKPASPQVS
ncbi:hypothetical protein [Gemmatimonas sp.]|uniref:hypothetical protein n=1 Tax=Gemmatimonas sp. TaxID=1962908 RepID=UPI0039836AB0